MSFRSHYLSHRLRGEVRDKKKPSNQERLKQGQYTEANQRFEYALGKTSFGENIEQIRNRLQEGLRLCKVKMNRKSEVEING
ncbi:hypothetical protein TNIN_365361 [Trichonephila inaurata madagascariensis]|uniref:Uncharacterized protein n=1 Tax=Trichonephila inaurata madagascariensis TaxID=2747483 RepID=A0A8X7BRU3_9ARAC|nr:hypothetical protein TNIN_365361 [Trichonephila inaurata madagascariensis]